MLEKPYEVKKNYYDVFTNWQTAINILYKSEKTQKKPMLWFKIKTRRLSDDIPRLNIFHQKINKEYGSNYYDKCKWYDSFDSSCDCPGIWHIDGPVISLDNSTVSPHRDIKDAAYLQILGKSFWKIDGKDIVVLEPNDLILVSNQITHEVWGEGPRMGILFFALNSK